MSTTNLNDYFKRARSWADDQFGRIEQSRNRYQVAFLSAMGVNVIALVVIGILAHVQTVVPMLVHHYDNGVTTVEPIKNKQTPVNRAQVESDIVRYIQYREAYDVSSYRKQFELVNLLSHNTVASEYLNEQNASKPSSHISLLGNHTKREVRIYSINFLDSLLANEDDIHKDHQPLAEVVLSLIDTDKLTGKTSASHYNVMMSWHYMNPPDSPETRWLNWDGFEVTRYSKQSRVAER